MTFGFLAAQLLLDTYAGTEGPDHRLFAFNRTLTRVSRPDHWRASYIRFRLCRFRGRFLAHLG